MSSHHWITLNALHLVRSYDISSFTGPDTVRQIVITVINTNVYFFVTRNCRAKLCNNESYVVDVQKVKLLTLEYLRILTIPDANLNASLKIHYFNTNIIDMYRYM